MTDLAIKKPLIDSSKTSSCRSFGTKSVEMQKKKQDEFQSTISDTAQTRINMALNGTAAACNLLATLNGNFSVIENIQEGLERLSNITSKIATASQGVINAIIACDKKNSIAMAGGLLELPIALFASGFNLFLARGASAGLNHFDSIISRTKKTDEKNNLVRDEKGNIQYFDHFRNEGWLYGLKTILKSIPKLSKELYTTPFERDGLFSRSFFLCSCFMVIGAVTGISGLTKIGAGIRHIFGGLAGIALTRDFKRNTNLKQKNEGIVQPRGISNYAISGWLWVIAAIPDYLKHFDFFSDKIKNGTELALCLDRLGALFFIFGNQRRGEKLAA